MFVRKFGNALREKALELLKFSLHKSISNLELSIDFFFNSMSFFDIKFLNLKKFFFSSNSDLDTISIFTSLKRSFISSDKS